MKSNKFYPDQLPLHWQAADNSLSRIFIFENFVQCVDFVLKISHLAEASNHHPDIEIFQYKHVRIKLSTHDEGQKITQKDIEVAEKINDLLKI